MRRGPPGGTRGAPGDGGRRRAARSPPARSSRWMHALSSSSSRARPHRTALGLRARADNLNSTRGEVELDSRRTHAREAIPPWAPGDLSGPAPSLGFTVDPSSRALRSYPRSPGGHARREVCARGACTLCRRRPSPDRHLTLAHHRDRSHIWKRKRLHFCPRPVCARVEDTHRQIDK